ncbi:hypothetical protein VPH35_058252 [Triticum aestivum]
MQSPALASLLRAPTRGRVPLAGLPRPAAAAPYAGSGSRLDPADWLHVRQTAAGFSTPVPTSPRAPPASAPAGCRVRLLPRRHTGSGSCVAPPASASTPAPAPPCRFLEPAAASTASPARASPIPAASAPAPASRCRPAPGRLRLPPPPGARPRPAACAKAEGPAAPPAKRKQEKSDAGC